MIDYTPPKITSFMWLFVKPHIRILIYMIIIVVIAAVCESLQPYVIKLLVDNLGTIKEIHSEDAIHSGIVIGLSFGALRLIVVIAWWFFQSLRAKVQPIIEIAVRKYLFEQILCHSYAWFLGGFSGRIGQRVETAVRASRDLFDSISDDICYVTVRGLTLVMIFFITDWRIGVAVSAWIVIALAMEKKRLLSTAEQSFKWTSSYGNFSQRILDVCSNVFTVKTNGDASKYEQMMCGNAANEAGIQHVRMVYNWRKINTSRTNMNTALYAILFVVGFILWRESSITLGDYAMLLSAGISTVGILESFSKKVQTFSQASGNLRESLEGLLDEKLALQTRYLPFEFSKGKIDFEDISFSYHSDRQVLDSFSLHIKAGEKVALIGPSGAGKTTIMSLLLGLWDAQKGKIKIDDQEVGVIKSEDLLRYIAVIPQDTSLFHRSLFENIAYGSSNSNIQSVESAAQKAHIHDFISSLPDGYNTLVGERGLSLSAGQRQRISIARAIHKNAPILLLDEATSALDSESEKAIQDALHELFQQKTILAIAHRLSTIAHMDRIIVIENGKIHEEGSHAELLGKNGRYAKLWGMQSAGYLPET